MIDDEKKPLFEVDIVVDPTLKEGEWYFEMPRKEPSRDTICAMCMKLLAMHDEQALLDCVRASKAIFGL
jgi:hypothetical protein